MMSLVRRFFLSGKTVICLIAAALFAITLSAFIPQSFLTPPEKMLAWRMAHPLLGSLSELLGLHHIYTHPVFSAVLAGAVVSLSLSTRDQCLAAWRRMSRLDPEMPGAESFAVAGSVEHCSQVISSLGFLRRNAGDGVVRFVRHPWGYWGNALLHFGMVVSIAASLFIALTQQRGVVQIAEGTPWYPSYPLLSEEHGLLAKPLVLPDTLRLDRVTYRFRPDNSVQRLGSTLSFISDAGTVETGSVEINEILIHRGMRFYQGVEFGHAFFVEVTGPDSLSRMFQLQIQHPEAPGRPAYNDYSGLFGEGQLLRAKYMVDAAGESFSRIDPLLTLLLEAGGKEIGRVPLKVGEEGVVGDYRFRLQAFAPWSRLLIVNLVGMPAIFLGFFIICLGGVLHYFTPPREVTVCEEAGGFVMVRWRAAKFDGFYMDELESLKQSLGLEDNHG